MEDNTREFVAYSRKLLRIIMLIRKALEDGDIENAKSMLDELIEDTERDIEA